MESRFDVLREVVDNLLANDESRAAKVVLDMMWCDVESTAELLGEAHAITRHDADEATMLNRRLHARP